MVRFGKWRVADAQRNEPRNLLPAKNEGSFYYKY